MNTQIYRYVIIGILFIHNIFGHDCQMSSYFWLLTATSFATYKPSSYAKLHTTLRFCEVFINQ